MLNFSDRLHDILNRANLTIYGASQIICAETDEELKTVHDRLTRWLKAPPKTWEDIETTLDALGYEVTIAPKTTKQ